MTDSDDIAQFVAAFVDHRESGESTSPEDWIEEAAVPAPARDAVLAACTSYLAVQRMVAADSAVPERSPIGRRIDDFEIEGEIGRGGMGVVYAAHQISLNRKVAIKILPHFMALSERNVAKFRNEARAIARLKDPHIVEVYGAGVAPGEIHYLAMELVRGHTLHDELSQLAGREPTKRVEPTLDTGTGRFTKIATLVAEIAEALAHAHQQGVVHRDVQPRNVLIDEHGAPKLIDFGLARVLEVAGLTRTGEIAGVPFYMSPEQVDPDRRAVDHRTDIYSLGVMLYELLTLTRPFDGDTSQQVLRAIEERRAKPPREIDDAIPPDLETICLRAIEKDPANRIDRADRLAAELRRFLAGESLTIRPAATGWRSGRWLRSRTTLWSAAALALAGLLVAWLASESPSAAQRSAATTNGSTTPDPAAASAPATAKRWAELTVTGPHVDGCRISYRPVVDLARYEFGPAVELGIAPVEAARLPLGVYRIRLEGEDGRLAERTVALWNDREVTRIGGQTRPQRLEDVLNQFDLVRIPAGRAVVGCDRKLRFHNAEPRSVRHDSYWIQRHEVRNSEYWRYVDATGANLPPVWPESWRGGIPADAADLPVAGVKLTEALDYAAWCGMRLPTQIEWDIAARGRLGFQLPWQQTFDIDSVRARANVERTIPQHLSLVEKYRAGVESVLTRSESASPFGLLHALGNVYEWVDAIPLGIFGHPETPNPGYGVARGAGFATAAESCDLTDQTEAPRVLATHHIGFRCARSDQ